MIDIIIPTYNRGDIITRAINSCGEHPIIVIDDGSTDNTKSIVLKYPNVSYYHTEHTGLPGRIKDIGIQKGTSDYFCILDSDDYLLPRAINIMEQNLKDRPALLYSNHYRDGNPGFNTKVELNILSMATMCPIRQLCVIRRDAYKSVGGFNQNMPAAVDTNLYLKIYKNYSDECMRVKKYLYYIDSTREDRISHTRTEIQEQLYLNNLKDFSKYYRKKSRNKWR